MATKTKLKTTMPPAASLMTQDRDLPDGRTHRVLINPRACSRYTKPRIKRGFVYLAEEEGFEPSRSLRPNTLSRRAP